MNDENWTAAMPNFKNDAFPVFEKEDAWSVGGGCV